MYPRGGTAQTARHFFSCNRAGGRVADSPAPAGGPPPDCSESIPRPGCLERDSGQEKFPESLILGLGISLYPIFPHSYPPPNFTPSFLPHSHRSRGGATSIPKKPNNQKTTVMKQKVKKPTQVGPGQAGESHADTSVSPHRILGGGNQLPSDAAPSAPLTQESHSAAVHAPNTLTPAAALAPQSTQTKPSTSAWQQSTVRNSFRNNPDYDQKDAGRATSSGGSIPTSAGEVRMHERGKALAGERRHGDRMRTAREGSSQSGEQTVASEQVRDRPRVREGSTQREKRPDAETRDRGRVREGETQREKSPGTLEPTGAKSPNRDRQRPDTERPPRRRARGKRLRAPHRGDPASITRPGASEPRPGPSGSGTAKRERPDDTASPSTLQGNPKRVRTQTAQGEQRTYARATKDIPARLSVAICFPPPSRDLTHTEATHIRTELERLLMQTDSTQPLPAFRGYPRVADGTVQMWCEDDNALTWLTLNVPKIRLPETDLTLTVMKQTDIPTRVRAALFVPRYNGDIAQLHSVLIRQNTWYDIGRWSLYRATSVGGDNHGTYLTLGIPTDEVEKVLGRERRISYMLGSIYVRFYPKTQPSDVKTDTEPTQTDDRDMARLEEDMARAAMADADSDPAPPTSPKWTAQLPSSSPTHDNWPVMEEGDKLSDGSVSS